MLHAVVTTFLALSLSSTPSPSIAQGGKVKFPSRSEKPKPPPQDTPDQDRPAPPPPEPHEEPRPHRPPQTVEEPHLRVIRENMSQVENCYARARAWSPALRGEVVLEWEISQDGTASRAQVVSNTTGNAELADCVLQAVKRWNFQDPNGGYPRHVRHPFRFQSS